MDQTAPLLETLESTHTGLVGLRDAVSAKSTLSDDELVASTRLIAECRDLLDGVSAGLAGEIATRSAPQLGSSGLAQRTGFRTPEELVRATGRLSGRDARAAVRAGRLMDGDADEPWLDSIAAALRDGSISIAAADAIRLGLGTPNSAVTAEHLAIAAAQLCAAATELDPDRLLVEARGARSELDSDGIALREEERRAARSLRMFSGSDGMGKLVWAMDPETFIAVKDLVDRATSPKLEGVRFGSDPAPTDDARTTEQLASDAFVQLLRAGADADSSSLLGSGAPVVKVTTTVKSRSARAGHGFLEGHPDPVSISTVERLACDGSEMEIIFDEGGRLVDATPDRRLYSRRQKEALAVRDGGCRFGNCARPPSWCEAHHVSFWARDGGKTVVDNGILLCRHHHLLVHNNGWQITVDDDGLYWLIPPRNVDAEQVPRQMPSKSAAMRQLTNEVSV
jgi:hypothetical protein